VGLLGLAGCAGGADVEGCEAVQTPAGKAWFAVHTYEDASVEDLAGHVHAVGEIREDPHFSAPMRGFDTVEVELYYRATDLGTEVAARCDRNGVPVFQEVTFLRDE
jgi:hypothetical protein